MSGINPRAKNMKTLKTLMTMVDINEGRMLSYLQLHQQDALIKSTNFGGHNIYEITSYWNNRFHFLLLYIIFHYFYLRINLK